ncbi:hypothetical protein ACROYT_G021256 [Oculina patagonica]
MALTQENEIPLPQNIQPFINTTLAWDNIDRLEETLSGSGTSHRVNGIAVQARHFGPQLPPLAVPEVARTRQRSVDSSTITEIPAYNAGERCNPRARSYVEVTSEQVIEHARKKNLLWILVRLHANAKQKASSWTGFNISVREQPVSKDNVGYLPTVDAPATDMATVHEVLVRSLKIKDSLRLQSIVVVFDQALYAKATEIQWKHSERFKDLVLRMGVFHTACTLLSIVGKRFQDAGLRDLCVESGVIAEGSVSGVLDGRRYNRAVRCHKLMYEALMRLAWKGLKTIIRIREERLMYSLIQELVCLSTGKAATNEIENDLLQAKDIGEKAYKSFSAERLECHPPKVKFHDTLTKAKLKTFSDLNKKMKVQKGTANEVILKADRALFAKMIVIAEKRELKMRDVLCHPLGPLPWALASADGSMRKTNKSSLGN